MLILDFIFISCFCTVFVVRHLRGTISYHTSYHIIRGGRAAPTYIISSEGIEDSSVPSAPSLYGRATWKSSILVCILIDSLALLASLYVC